MIEVALKHFLILPHSTSGPILPNYSRLVQYRPIIAQACQHSIRLKEKRTFSEGKEKYHEEKDIFCVKNCHFLTTRIFCRYVPKILAPSAHHCGPLAHFLMSILVQVTLDDVAKLFYFIPKCYILATSCKKCGISTIFGNILAILEDFLNELGEK